MSISKPLETSRIPALDWIRGLALLGILLINVQTYSLFAFLQPQQVYELGLDQPAMYAPLQFFIHILVKGQFYTIYSFLFGLGFYLMWARNNRADLPADQLFRRRLWVLLLLGLIHAFVFWFGDILHKYALLGFTLPYFNKKSVATLLKWMAGLVVVGLVLPLIQRLGFAATTAEIAQSQHQMNTVMRQVVHTWQYGSVEQVMGLQKLGVLLLHMMAVKTGMASYLQYELMFLLGLITGKLDLFSRLTEVRNQFLRRAFWIFPLGLLLKGLTGLSVFDVQLLPPGQEAYQQLIVAGADFLGSPLLTLVYLIELALYVDRHPSRLTRWIGNAGRLGLTNYLGQTLVCMGLFYGYGLGLSGRLTLLETLGVALGIYALQVSYSTLWLRYYRQGPLEWLWRKVTYGNYPAGAIPAPPLDPLRIK